MSLRSEFRVLIYIFVTISVYNDVRLVFNAGFLLAGSCFIYVICVCLRIVVSIIYCVIFFLRLVYPMLPVFFWIANFVLPLL